MIMSIMIKTTMMKMTKQVSPQWVLTVAHCPDMIDDNDHDNEQDDESSNDDHIIVIVMITGVSSMGANSGSLS